MPIVFGVVGLLLVVSGVRGTTSSLMTVVKADFTPNGGYLRWMLGIGLVGALGYIDELKTISRMFMALVLIGLIWSNKGVFADLTKETATAAPVSTTPTSTATSTPNMLPQLPSLPSNIDGLTGLGELTAS